MKQSDLSPDEERELSKRMSDLAKRQWVGKSRGERQRRLLERLRKMQDPETGIPVTEQVQEVTTPERAPMPVVAAACTSPGVGSAVELSPAAKEYAARLAKGRAAVAAAEAKAGVEPVEPGAVPPEPVVVRDDDQIL